MSRFWQQGLAAVAAAALAIGCATAEDLVLFRDAGLGGDATPGANGGGPPGGGGTDGMGGAPGGGGAPPGSGGAPPGSGGTIGSGGRIGSGGVGTAGTATCNVMGCPACAFGGTQCCKPNNTCGCSLFGFPCG